MSKKRLITFVALGFVLTLLSFGYGEYNQYCDYVNEYEGKTASYKRGFPLSYNDESTRICSTYGEVGDNYGDFAQADQAQAFLFNWLTWSSISFTLYTLRKAVGRKKQASMRKSKHD
jgi:hypothetical protein